MKTPEISFFSYLRQTCSAQRFALIAGLLCIAYYLLEWVNGRSQMADFRVYYDAASAFASGEQVYGLAFGVSSGFYKYSPFACLPFLPFAALPYGTASCIYYLILTAAIVWFSLYLLFRIEQNWPALKHRGWILVCVTVFMLDHLERELHLGNVNLFLLIGAFFIFDFLHRKKEGLSGLLYALILLFKPHFLLLLPWFVWKKKWKLVIGTIAGFLLGLFVPAVLKGWQGNLDLLHQWSMAMQDHNLALEHSPNTLYGLINHYILGDSAGVLLVLLLLLVVAGAFLLLMIRNKRQHPDESLPFIEYFMLVALIPNLVHTDTEHFMWTWPLIAYSIIYLFQHGFRENRLLIFAMILAFIPYGVNSPDIVGKQLRFLFDEGGLLGLANLVMIAAAVWIHLRTGQNKSLPKF